MIQNLLRRRGDYDVYHDLLNATDVAERPFEETVACPDYRMPDAPLRWGIRRFIYLRWMF
jgi:hypothetical protein